MKGQPTIGPGELAVLHYITDHHPITVAEVAEHFAATAGHVRTTVLNMMERLRKKGFLTRRKIRGVYHYSPRKSRAELLQNLVRDFVEKALGGSVAPFAAYLAGRSDLNAAQKKELEELIQNIEAQRKDR